MSDMVNLQAAVFSQPPIGQVGLTEEQAIKEYGDVDIFTSNFRPLCTPPDRLFLKLIISEKTKKIVGINMQGNGATEIIQGFAVAVTAGLTKANLDATIDMHPKVRSELFMMSAPTRKIRINVTEDANNAKRRKVYAEKKEKGLLQKRKNPATNNTTEMEHIDTTDRDAKSAKRRKVYGEKIEKALFEKREKTAFDQWTKTMKKNVGLSDIVPNCATRLPMTSDCVHCKAKRFKGESNFFLLQWW